MLQTVVRVAQIGFLVTATAALGWFLWGKLDTEPRRELDPFRRTLAQHVVTSVTGELPRRDELRWVAVVPVARDVDDRVYDMLLEAVEGSELYFVVDDSFVYEHLRDEWEGRRPTDLDTALALGRELREKDGRTDGVLFAALRTFRPGRRDGLGAEVTLDAWLLDVEKGGVVPQGVVSATDKLESRASFDYYAAYMETTSVVGRFLLFVLYSVGLPFALYPLASVVVRRRETRLNIALVAALTLSNALVLAALMGFRPGLFGWFLLLVGTLGAGLYNMIICDKIDDAV